jgi:hypothetical protein
MFSADKLTLLDQLKKSAFFGILFSKNSLINYLLNIIA